MAKSNRELVKLESTAGTGYFYVKSKNRKTGARTVTSRVPAWAKDRMKRWAS